MQSCRNFPDPGEADNTPLEGAMLSLVGDTHTETNTSGDKTSVLCSELKVAATRNPDAQILPISPLKTY